jgi:hypothetical protein
VKGLVDADTKGKILSMVNQMNLDETVAFVESGKRDLLLLCGGPSSGQVNAVQGGTGQVLEVWSIGRVKDEKSQLGITAICFLAQFCMEKQNSLPF